MKIFNKIMHIVSKIRGLGGFSGFGENSGIFAKYIFSGILAIVAPERESVRMLIKMNPAEIKKLIRPVVWKSVLSVGSVGFSTENLHAIFAYSDPLARQVVWEIKYRKNLALADKVGQLIFEEMVKCAGGEKISPCGAMEYLEVAKFARENEREKIIIAPIPSSKRRRRERGFNQCEVICEAVMRCVNVRGVYSARDTKTRREVREMSEIFIYEPNLLAKIKDTPHQADLPREKRLKNISDSFAIPSPEKVAGKIIFIVDDVITTGKTISEAEKFLIAAGAKRVYGFAVAH